PTRSPSQPKRTPPAAAPTRKAAMMPANQGPMSPSLPELRSSSLSAGRPARGKRPISRPSNIQPRKAATRAMVRPFVSDSGDEAMGPVLSHRGSERPRLGLVRERGFKHEPD